MDDIASYNFSHPLFTVVRLTTIYNNNTLLNFSSYKSVGFYSVVEGLNSPSF